MSPARVIGVGSPFGADRIGWEVVDQLAFSTGLPSGRVVFSRCARPDGELLAALAQPGLLVLIDAMRSGGIPGTVRRVSAAELMQAGGLISSHGFGIKPALSLAAALGGLAAEVRICGIEIPPDPVAHGAEPIPADVRVDTGILSEIKKILMETLQEFGYL